MKLLLDHSSFHHNVDSDFEGTYRIQDFTPNIDTKTYIDWEEYLELIHSDVYIHNIKNACNMRAYLAEVELSPESYTAACNAVGLAIHASKNNDFAIVRPPWHHAFREQASGFCFFNNIAIAAQYLVNTWKRVAILDIDGHHGDGTQSILYDTDKVFFWSIHQIWTFPGTGYEYETGNWIWKWYTKNYILEPWDGDREFIDAVKNSIEDIEKFQPDIVAISAWFDGYLKDKVLDLEFSSQVYYKCWKLLSQKFGNIFAVLEWWYHEDMKECIELFVSWINEWKK